MSIITAVLNAANQGAVQAAVLVAKAKNDTEFDATKVSPGAEGFIATAAFAAAVIVLGFLLTSRIRRNRYRHEVREEIDAELAEAAGQAPQGGSAEPRNDA